VADDLDSVLDLVVK